MPKTARSALVLRTAAALLGAVLSVSAVQAQTQAPEADAAEILVFEKMRVPRWLAETVVRAAEVTGVDPSYMMALADKESSLLPDNKARTSSAEGLFQFVEGTWLEVLRRYAPSTATPLRRRRSRSSRAGRWWPTPGSVRPS